MRNVRLGLLLLCLYQLSCVSDEAPPPPPIRDFSVASQSEVWVVTAKGKILHFSNGELVQEKTDVKSKAVQIFFLNSDRGWILDADAWIWSTNNGRDWKKQGKIGDESSAGLSNNLIFANEQVGWLTTSFGVWLTEDGGTTWRSVYPNEQMPFETTLSRYFPIDDNSGWLSMTNSRLLRTADRGNSWTAVSLPGKWGNYALYAPNERECWAGTGHFEGLLYTNDGGVNWKELIGDEQRARLAIHSLSFPTKEIGWVAGSEAATVDPFKESKGALLKSTDGGMTWKSSAHGLNEKWFQWVKFTDSQNGWLVSADTVYRSADGGSSWTKAFHIE